MNAVCVSELTATTGNLSRASMQHPMTSHTPSRQARTIAYLVFEWMLQMLT